MTDMRNLINIMEGKFGRSPFQQIDHNSILTRTILYHGSPVGDIKEFRSFTHFGTKKSALERMGKRPGYLYEVEITFNNLLRVTDNAAADYATLLHWLITNRESLKPDLQMARTEGSDKAVVALGYDGLIYVNEFEDIGKDSYVTMLPNQARIISVTDIDDHRGTLREMQIVEGYRFYKDCVAHNDNDVEYLIAMQEDGREITYETFVKAVGLSEVRDVFEPMGYDFSRRPRGMTIMTFDLTSGPLDGRIQNSIDISLISDGFSFHEIEKPLDKVDVFAHQLFIINSQCDWMRLPDPPT